MEARLHGAQWQSIRHYIHIESLSNHKKTPRVCVCVAGQPLEQVSQRGCDASVFKCSELNFLWSCAIQFWWFCFKLRSLLWSQVEDRGENCGLDFQRLSLPKSMILWNWEQNALLSPSSLFFSCFQKWWKIIVFTLTFCGFLLRTDSTNFS